MDRFEYTGGFYCRDGMAKERGMKTNCKKKLCLISNDHQFLLDHMYEASIANDCYEVKVAKYDRAGMFIAKCSFTNDSSLGDAWARYESHPKAWCVIHDDEFVEPFKSRIRSYTA